MKKRKLLLSTLAAAVFATSAGALVACGDGLDLPNNGGKQPTDTSKGYTVTFVPGADAKLTKIDGTTLTTNKDGKLTATTMPEAEKNTNKDDYTFLGWGLAAGATTPEFTASDYKSYKFSANTSVYAVFKENDEPGPGPGPGPGPVVTDEYDITFVAGPNGSLFGTTSVKTSNGIATFPEPVADSGYEFDYWALTNGTHVDSSYTFTDGATVTAYFKEADGPIIVDPPQGDCNLYLRGDMNGWGNDNKLTAIDPDTANDMKEQYSVEFTTTEANQEMKLWEDDGTEDGAWIGFDQAFVAGTPDVELTVESNGNVKVPAAGTYIAYIKVYNSGWIRVDFVNQGGEQPPIIVDPPQPGESKFYVYGTVGGDSKWSAETGYEFEEIDPDEGEVLLKKYKVEIELSVGDEVKIFKTNDQEHEWNYNNVESGCLGDYIAWGTDNLEVKKAGTFTFYLKLYEDGNSVWIAYDGEDDPNPPTPPTTEVAKVNDTTMTDNSANISHENEQGQPINQTLTKEYMLQGVELAKNATVSFKINDTVVEVWLEKNTNVAISGANTRATSFTITADGTYDFYLKYYTDGGADRKGGWNVWVDGTTEEDDPTPDDPDENGLVAVDTEAENKGYLVGDLATPGTFDGDNGVLMQLTTSGYGGQEFVLENYHLDKGTLFKFRNGTGSAWTANLKGGTASACFEIVQDNDGQDNIKVVRGGTFTFYVKTGANGEIYINGTPDYEPPEGDMITVTVKCKDGDITFNIEKDGTKQVQLHGWIKGGSDLFGGWPGKNIGDGETVTLTDYNMTQLGLIVHYNGGKQTNNIELTTGGNKTITVAKDGSCNIA